MQSRKWVVHHNCLKPYKGPWRKVTATSLQGLDPPVVSSAEAPYSIPLTGLAGALPSTPSFVPNQSVKQNTTKTRTECSKTTDLLSVPDSLLSLSASLGTSKTSARAILPVAQAPQLTHSGHMVKKPEKI